MSSLRCEHDFAFDLRLPIRRCEKLGVVTNSIPSIGEIMSLKWLGICFAIAAVILVANVTLTVLYMVVYGHFIDPGHEPKYYADHVQVAGPYCGIIGGSFLMLVAGFLCARRFEKSKARENVAGVWAAYGILDFSILAMAGLNGTIVAFFAVSMIAKALAGFAGLSMGQPRTNPL